MKKDSYVKKCRAIYGLRLQVFDSWNRGFESRWGMDIFLLCFLCCVVLFLTLCNVALPIIRL